MPKVQTAPIGQVDPNVLPTVRLSANARPESFGAGALKPLAQAFSTLGDVGQIVAREAGKADDTKGTNTANDWSEWARDYENTALLKTGEDAEQVFNQAQADFKKKRKEFEDSLSNERQKETFRRGSQAAENNMLRGLGSFSRKAIQSNNIRSKEGAISEAGQRGIGGRNDSQTVQDNHDNVIDESLALARETGLSQDETKALVRQNMHIYHKGIYDAFIEEDNPEAALAHLKQYGTLMQQGEIAGLKAKAKVEKKDNDAKDTAADFVRDGLTPEQVEAKTLAMSDRDQAAAIQKTYNALHNQQRANEAERRAKQSREVSISVLDSIEKGEVTAVLKLPADLDPGTRQALQVAWGKANIKRLRMAGELPPEDTSPEGIILMDKLMRMNAEEAAAVDPASYIRILDPADSKAVLAQHRKIAGEEGDEAKKNAESFARWKTQATDTFATINFFPDTDFFGVGGGDSDFEEAEVKRRTAGLKASYLVAFEEELALLAPKERTRANVDAIIKDLLRPTGMQVEADANVWFINDTERPVFAFELRDITGLIPQFDPDDLPEGSAKARTILMNNAPIPLRNKAKNKGAIMSAVFNPKGLPKSGWVYALRRGELIVYYSLRGTKIGIPKNDN